MSDDRYLWDKTGEPDEETLALERALARHRWRGDAPPPAWVEGMRGEDFDGRRRPARRPARAFALLAVAALLLVAAALGIRQAVREAPRADAPNGGAAGAAPYRVVALAGRPTVEGGSVGADGATFGLSPGQRLACDADARAELEVGDIGRVSLGPSSSLRVEAAGAAERAAGAEHVLFLERGTMTASIFAAPRVFQVGTPSGIAVDLGCVYTAVVADDGATWLCVDSGLVSFEAAARRVTVPAGASTRAWPVRGPGTPVWDAKPDAWREAVERLDERERYDESDLALVLATDDAQDSLTLWHLFAHPSRELRARVYDRLAALAPPPAGVTREACVARDADVLERWKDELGWGW